MTISPGTRIKELRTIFGMSQEELGKRVGVQRAAINKYEIGTVQNIPLKTIEKMAKVFDVSPNYIVGWGDDAGNPLATEVKIVQGVSRIFGSDAVEVLENFIRLTPAGRKRVLQYIDDISRLYADSDVE